MALQINPEVHLVGLTGGRLGWPEPGCQLPGRRMLWVWQPRLTLPILSAPSITPLSTIYDLLSMLYLLSTHLSAPRSCVWRRRSLGGSAPGRWAADTAPPRGSSPGSRQSSLRNPSLGIRRYHVTDVDIQLLYDCCRYVDTIM